ncbi:TetR family transcriptional regulator [Rhizobium sp. NTR19]|uniref:TetR family transcriptional regulator n=1 Tax=Neorhizobium turbinariae TaxID=2937795 RepID=A0ABT0IQC0_9HYPH|nr:TetR/AcrR family transcriptional regulator [Neorhizobium turbinariae]MCK8780074.1 TetR family transcriptional regulator [Neorhizobium turbinariae]
MPDSTGGQGSNSLRRVPKQERSRDRIDEILKVSMELIGRKGIDAVTMKEIAALSGGPIASVYQYFPNKSAIIGTLYERYADEVRSFVFDHIKGIENASDAVDATTGLFDLYYNQMRERPSTQDLLNAIQADKRLSDRDINETRVQAEMFYDATFQFVDEARRQDYRETLLVMFHMAGSTLRLALMVPQAEAEQLVKQFKSITRAQATYYLKGSFPTEL